MPGSGSKIMRSIRLSIAALSFCLTAAFFVNGQTLPTLRILQDHITGLSSPVLLTHADDGTRRKFIVQQGGTIRVLQPGSTTHTQFMNITSRVLSGGERGLLGLAFHPQFETNSYFFVNYTRQTDGATVIARFTATNNNTVGDPNSERIVLTIAQPFSNHNGGGIAFGADGHLYIGMGDGGSGNDPGSRAQNINELLGKFLRITPDVSGVGTNPPYTNPPDNPYVGIAGADEIYAIGLRNPWRWSFDRGGTNQLWAADVGQGTWEEVSVITRGGNFGWRAYEGFNCTGLNPELCTGGANPIIHSQPVLQYSSASPNPECSITGGYVYRGVQDARVKGEYLFGDFCSGKIWTWFNSQQILLLDTSRSISSFGEDEDGELYVVHHGGAIDKILGNKTSADFNGDRQTDISVYRPSTGQWYVRNSQNGNVTVTGFGTSGDVPATKDYDGDLIADIAVFRPLNGTWYMLRSSDSTFAAVPFGFNGDVPAAGDYDGDGKADLTVFRPSTGDWYLLRSNLGFTALNFGLNGDIPTPGDYDGDGRYDIAVFRPSDGIWYRLNSSNPTGGTINFPFGVNGDIPAQGDFDGDTVNDIAVFRPSTGQWYISRSLFGFQVTSWGVNGDVPVVGDYDGDGRDDIAVFRPSTGIWYALRSSNSTMLAVHFGVSQDLPIPNYDKP